MKTSTVVNMTSNSGKAIANQFIITDENGNKTFQSYSSVIAYVECGTNEIMLDCGLWDFSATTSRYLNTFLSDFITGQKVNKAYIVKCIKDGKILLSDLN